MVTIQNTVHLGYYIGYRDFVGALSVAFTII